MAHLATTAVTLTLLSVPSTAEPQAAPAATTTISVGDELALFKLDEEAVIDGRERFTPFSTKPSSAAAGAVAAGRLTPPRRLAGPDPEYTARAYEHEIEGRMAVECILGADGHVRKCRALKTLPFLERTAIDALEARTYAPAELDGRPIDVAYTFHLTFKMPR